MTREGGTRPVGLPANLGKVRDPYLTFALSFLVTRTRLAPGSGAESAAPVPSRISLGPSAYEHRFLDEVSPELNLDCWELGNGARCALELPADWCD